MQREVHKRPRKRNRRSTDGSPIVYLPEKSLAQTNGNTPGRIIFFVVILCIAIALCFYVLWNVSSVFIEEDSLSETPIDQVLITTDYEFPPAESISLLSSNEILTYLDEQGISYYNNTNSNQAEAGGLDVFKLPPTIDAMTTAALLAQGVDNLTASEAIALLNGSWRISLASEDNYDLRVRFASFETHSDSDAILQAADDFNLTDTRTTDPAVDANGNTFIEGELVNNGETVQWKLSACPLVDIYDVTDIPEDASFVVLRIYK